MNDLGCTYCSNMELFNIDFSGCAESSEMGLAARGHFLKKIRNPHYPAWPIDVIARQKGQQYSKLLIGKEHFAPNWRHFNVEILGLALTRKPSMPPLPLFGLSTTGPLVRVEGKNYWIRDRERTNYILWNACRIAHEGFGFVIKLHWWPDHGRIFTVENLEFDDVTAIAALKKGLSIFSRGRGRTPSENFTSNKQFLSALNEAIIRRHNAGSAPADIREVEIADDLFPESKHASRELRRWLQTSWRKFRWPDIVKAVVNDEMEDRYSMGEDLTFNRI